MIPSIANLLNDAEDAITYDCHRAPKLCIVPPSPSMLPSTDNNSTCPSPMSSSSYCLSPSFPPSPIDSPLPPTFDVIGNEDDSRHCHALPPLQGCDPHPQCTSRSTQLAESLLWGTKRFVTNNHPPFSFEHHAFGPPAGQPPVFKRQRGRPRSATLQSLCLNRDIPSGGDSETDGRLTFLAPTTWDVPPAANRSNTPAVDFEDELRAPRKKRGRKPRVHLEGHSCFVLPSSLQEKLKKAR
ncbi:hypothetical protein BX666DRAFT_2003145 [Dichotomocladium elegans]|nr:hypothetical protein BX666DRAFT_2003145 [Dichotomocladium elegans]